FSSRRRHTRFSRDWSSDVCSSDLEGNLMLKADLATINEQMLNLREGLQGHLTERLDKNQESMSKQLEASAKLIKDVTERLTKLEIGRASCRERVEMRGVGEA